MENDMDRRQRKTRDAIFQAFTELLSQKNFNQITVGEIIERADVGRATFYAHFETKDYLLKAFCEELFCHIFDVENSEMTHRHIFSCDGAASPFLHLLQHIQKNDNHILDLLSSTNNDLFLRYFRENLETLVQNHVSLFAPHRDDRLPDGFWKNHITSTFIEILRWWIENGMQESPETITEYFMIVV